MVRHNGREDLEAARHTDQVVARRVQRAVAEVAGSRAEGGHHIVGRVEGLAVGLRSLLGTAGLVEGRIRVDRRLAVGVEEAGHIHVEEEVGRIRLAEVEGRCCNSQTCCCPLLLLA